MPQPSSRPSPKPARASHSVEKGSENGKSGEDTLGTIATAKTAREQQGRRRQAFAAVRKAAFRRRWWWAVGFWAWCLAVHAIGLGLFTSGFLLTRLVLYQRSDCSMPPVDLGEGWSEVNCWHPKSFERAVVLVIDALRYDFAVPIPESDAHHFHNGLRVLYETAAMEPAHAFLRPFIADPPTTTLQRLKGLTTGNLPTFVDIGSNFAGTAIDEDNIVTQLRHLGKRIAHIGDDTWSALFPDHFESTISRPYDSFNVWDLHTVDDGVIEHLSPLLQPDRTGEWDFLVGHCLGVDHAGHRYGPDHPAMAAKLRQMDQLVRNLTSLLDEDTLLVVLGDHGMDSKGDHGGESDDEVQSTLWMYAKRPFFGSTDPALLAAGPPAKATIRPVAQIDLVSTLALLIGIPIPYNNLGRPIEEAFIGAGWQNLAAATRVAAGGIRRYQQSYFAARGMGPNADLAKLWDRAEQLVATGQPKEVYGAYAEFQQETLRICRAMWAQFDLGKMMTGIAVMLIGLVALVLYVTRRGDEVQAEAEAEPEPGADGSDILQFARYQAGLVAGEKPKTDRAHHHTLHRRLLRGAALGAVPGALAGVVLRLVLGAEWAMVAAAAAGLSGLGVVIARLSPTATDSAGSRLVDSWLWWLPSSGWGWLMVLFAVSQSIGFASNSYTVWEDSILLFFLATFGAVHLVAGMRLGSGRDRQLTMQHAIGFMVLGRLGSVLKVCREEQMPYCRSTYYASATSSTSAPWQVLVPFAVTVLLPQVVRWFLAGPRSYEGLAPAWVAGGLRVVLLTAAVAWLLDAADDGGWVQGAPAWMPSLKTGRVALAQVGLLLAVAVGTVAYTVASPCVSVTVRPGQVTILGYGNAHGARYLLLVLVVVAACAVVTKPVGMGALALMLWQVLLLAELSELNNDASGGARAAAPAALALLGNFYFFKTGHQASLASIQWDAAFVALPTVRHPWSGLAVAANSFAGPIVAAAAVPAVVLWKAGPRRRRALEATVRALAAFAAVFAVQALATMACAGWLRRHLMLYRVFMPRFLLAAVLLLVVDLVLVGVALAGVRVSVNSVCDVFGWVDGEPEDGCLDEDGAAGEKGSQGEWLGRVWSVLR